MVTRAHVCLLVLASFAACRGDGVHVDNQTASQPGAIPPSAPRDAVNSGNPGDGGSGLANVDSLPADRATGDVQVRVEWKAVPVAARASAGHTACQTARAAAVAPTTMWGIPEVIVIVDGAPAPVDATRAPVRVLLADCVLSPRVGTGPALTVASGVDRPATVLVAKRGTLGTLATLDGTAAATTLRLPIAGHAVALALEPGGIYEVRTVDVPAESAWVIGATGEITDPTGQVLVRDVAPGRHAVTAWLPPRGGQAARVAHGTVEVVAGDLAELVVELQ